MDTFGADSVIALLSMTLHNRWMWFKTDKQPQNCPLWARMSSAMPQTLFAHNGHFLGVYLNCNTGENHFLVPVKITINVNNQLIRHPHPRPFNIHPLSLPLIYGGQHWKPVKICSLE